MSKERWALLSVSCKDGIVDFSWALIVLGFKLLASGGTAKFLKERGVEVKDVAELIGGGAILGHRVVTLSRQVHAGLLAEYTDAAKEEMAKLGIPYIDLACVDFYPLIATINSPDCSPEKVLEKTDIGGPTMVRSAAKGRRIVICDPADRQKVLDWLRAGEPDREDFITALAAKAEFTVAAYTLSSAMYWGKGQYAGMLGEKVMDLKYGENATQWAKMYRDVLYPDPLSVVNSSMVGGSKIGYVNVTDFDRLIALAVQTHANFAGYTQTPYLVAVDKHGNPCGVGISFVSPAEAMERAIDGDLDSIYGCAGVTNFPIDETLADTILHYKMKGDDQRLIDGLISPSFTKGAAEMFRRKTGKCPLMALPALNELIMSKATILRQLRGGFLTQSPSEFVLDLSDTELEKIGDLTKDQEIDILLADAICRTSNSNTITLVKNKSLIGNGAGQTSRKRAAWLARDIAIECGHDPRGAVAASDSFFPFNDGPQILFDAGIEAIFATKFGKNYEDFINLCRERSIKTLTLPDKKARGFARHG